jgi:periplasmic protein TonB
MFNNLIESRSHRDEFRRRGSFLLFTTGSYVILFVITGVISIYAYDAHLENQTTELELLTFVPPPAPPEVVPEVPRNTLQPSANANGNPTRSTRIELIDTTSNPNNVPRDVGTVAPNVPPARSDSVVGTTNADPVGPASVHGSSEGTGGTATEPPPAPTPGPPVKKILTVSRVLNSQALFLPKPAYPPMAKQIRVQGTVSVQVLIDETGKVISAKAVSGHPLLAAEAVRAATQARFSPTLLGEQPVKVSGVISYNFVMQ